VLIMRTKGAYKRTLFPVALGLLLALGPRVSHGDTPQTAVKQVTHSRIVLSVFRPIIPRLTGVGIPVYLPSWLPQRLFNQPLGVVLEYPPTVSDYSVGLSNYKQGNAWSSCNACLPFFIGGGAPKLHSPPKVIPGPVGQRVRRVPLGSGAIGYRVEVLGGSMGEYFTWNIGSHSYLMRLGSATDAEYAQVARLVVAVQPPTAHLRRQVTFFSVSGGGNQNTQWFNAPNEWQLHWWYNCRSTGSTGNFIVEVKNHGFGLPEISVNELGWGKSGIQYAHNGGRFYLNITTGCNQWHVWLTR
jgi:hypothetical protein